MLLKSLRYKREQSCNVFFFFSSRRRHTRFDCDWSSDVCSSDLDRGHPGDDLVGPEDGLVMMLPDLSVHLEIVARERELGEVREVGPRTENHADRKSTRLNSSHSQISYAVFCLKKKKNHVISPYSDQTSQFVLQRANENSRVYYYNKVQL